MSEARELFERFHEILMDRVKQARGAGLDQEAARIGVIGASVAEALAAPPPDAVPELPAWLRGPDRDGEYRITLPCGSVRWLAADAIDRISEACRILAARRRAEG